MNVSFPASQSGKVAVFLLIAIFAAGVVFAGIVNIGLSATNEMDFCTSCHSMQVNLEEYKATVHYKNASGVRATCADCHVPKEFIPKMIAKVMAAKDVFHELIGTIDTQEKYEAHRWKMANRVWDKMKSTNSRECRTCHDFSRWIWACRIARRADVMPMLKTQARPVSIVIKASLIMNRTSRKSPPRLKPNPNTC